MRTVNRPVTATPAARVAKRDSAIMNGDATHCKNEMAVQWNMKGVDALRAGDVRNASNFFWQGLESTRMPTADTLGGPDLLSRVFWPPPRRTLVRGVTLSAHDRTVAAHNDFFAMYNGAFDIYPDDGSLCPSLYFHLVVGVLIFNVGLSSHLEALPSGNTAKLKKALDFYSMSRMIFSSKFSLGQAFGSYTDLIYLVSMASVNNMGHVYAYSRELEHVKVCAEEVCRMLAHLTQPNNALPFISMDDQDYHIFFLNLCFFRESQLVVAPAA